MFYKRNGNRKRRPSAPDATLSPRFARLVRESWCLLVAAVLLYIARPTAALPLDLDQRSVRRVFELEI